MVAGSFGVAFPRFPAFIGHVAVRKLVIIALLFIGSQPAWAGLRVAFQFGGNFCAPRYTAPRCYVPRYCYYQPAYYWIGPSYISYTSGPIYSVAAPLTFSTTATVDVPAPREKRAPLLDEPIEVPPVAFQWRR